jgi:hypothetical protein
MSPTMSIVCFTEPIQLFLPGVGDGVRVTVYLGRSAIDWDVCVPCINGYHVIRLANRPLPNYEYSAYHKAREQPL